MSNYAALILCNLEYYVLSYTAVIFCNLVYIKLYIISLYRGEIVLNKCKPFESISLVCEVSMVPPHSYRIAAVRTLEGDV